MTLSDLIFNVKGTLTEQEDVLRCLRTLVMTPAGTVPLDRDFGIDNSMLGQPMGVAENLLAVELITKVRRYEPRASVQQVELTASPEGNITAKVVITSA